MVFRIGMPGWAVPSHPANSSLSLILWGNTQKGTRTAISEATVVNHAS
jgi:hypothetical protein